MSTPTFDTLKFAETLKAGGVPEPQAKAFTTAFATAVEEGAGQWVTRQDLKDTENALRQEIKDVEVRLLWRMVTIAFLQAGLIVTLIKFLPGPTS